MLKNLLENKTVKVLCFVLIVLIGINLVCYIINFTSNISSTEQTNVTIAARQWSRRTFGQRIIPDSVVCTDIKYDSTHGSGYICYGLDAEYHRLEFRCNQQGCFLVYEDDYRRDIEHERYCR